MAHGIEALARGPRCRHCAAASGIEALLVARRHHLVDGDIIKLGRFKFKVRQLGTDHLAQPELRLDDANGACRGLIYKEEAAPKVALRVLTTKL